MAYEYKEVHTDGSKASFFLDGYENFGWQADENMMDDQRDRFVEKTEPSSQDKIVLHLKRDRKIINKAELTRLQRHFEACAAELDVLEKEKTSRALIFALTLGLIGTAFIAGSVFAVTAQPPLIEAKYDEIYEICEKGHKLLN